MSRRLTRVVLGAVTAIPMVATGAGAAGAASAPAAPSAPAFPQPTAVTNRYLPLAPGTSWVLDGRAEDDKGRLQQHRVVTIVTDLTKVIKGVRTLVVWDQDFSNGRLVESELAFFAQDRSGRVWSFGEYPELYDRGKFEGAPDTWIAGLARAKEGIAMLAQPRVGTPAYSQGDAPKVDFADRARVFQTGQRVCLPTTRRCFSNVVVTDEWDALDPKGGHQRKYYAPRVGNVRVGAVGGDQETLNLVRYRRLCAAEVAGVRARAVAMDKRGHRISKVYRKTAPVQHTLRARTTC